MFAGTGIRVAKLVPAEVSMVWDVSFTCDICGKTKGEANHWWMLSYADCACDEDDQVPQRFSVMPWNAGQARNPEMRHLCGKGCAMQALERFMTQKDRFMTQRPDISGFRPQCAATSA